MIKIIFTLILGNNFFETDEFTQAHEEYKKAYALLEHIADEDLKKKFITYEHQLNTNIGFMEIRNENTEKGLMYL